MNIAIEKELAYEYNPLIFNKYDHIKIEIQINDNKYDALIDTGSTISLINKSIIDLFISIKNIDIIEADILCSDKKIFTILGIVYNIKFKYNERDYIMNFNVVNELDKTKYDIILGLDFLYSYGITLDFKKQNIMERDKIQ